MIQELVVGSDIKDILGKRPEDRSEEEIQQVLFALRTYETFAEYPLNMQVMNRSRVFSRLLSLFKRKEIFPCVRKSPRSS